MSRKSYYIYAFYLRLVNILGLRLDNRDVKMVLVASNSDIKRNFIASQRFTL